MEEIKNQQNDVQGTETAEQIIESLRNEVENLKKELKRYFKENIASYKRPRVIEFVDEMPKTISGKVRRVEIKEKDWK